MGLIEKTDLKYGYGNLLNRLVTDDEYSKTTTMFTVFVGVYFLFSYVS